MKAFCKTMVTSLLLSLAIGCGSGGSSTCPDDKPLHCPNDACCGRGYPYNCGDGLCYRNGCPAGSPSVGVCQLKSAEFGEEQVDVSVPVIDEKQAKMCVPEGYPDEDPSESASGN